MNSDFKIKFDGQEHQIDASILINNLIHTTSIIQELNRELDTGKRIDIKIKALEKGSFLIHIGLDETALDHLKNIFTRENIGVAGSIISSLVGIIEFKKFLKGKKIKSKSVSGDEVKIENENGEVTYIKNSVFNIYDRNATVKDAISKSFQALENDPAVEGYEITDKDENPMIRVEREDFENLSSLSEEITEGERIIKQSASLHIVKVSFEKNLKWEFYFKGNKITAKIEDPDFQKMIDNGEPFAKGDVLEVELSIKQKFDLSVKTYVNKSYKIEKIINHRKKDEPLKFDFDKKHPNN